MAVFRYEAIDGTGRITSGVRTAELVQEVEQWLLENRLSPVDIRLTGQGGLEQAEGGQALSLRERLRGVELEDLILFCRQLATMLGAGVALLQGLQIMTRQVGNSRLREILHEVAGEIEGGATLSDAFARHPKVFNRLFRNLVKVGEESGNLDNAFEYLAGLYENEKDIQERIKSATRYPKLVITALTGAVFFLMTFVVPKFISLFSKAKVELPLPTRLLIAVSSLCVHHTLLILVLAAALVASYKLALRSEGFVWERDRLLLRLPVLGDLTTRLYMARFCRVFAVLTTSGIDIIRTLELAATALDNLVLFRMVNEVRVEVEGGVGLNQAMGKRPVFPAMVVQMIAIGEEAGQMDIMMNKVADYYEAETSYTIKRLATYIEPAMLLVLGTIVAFIALAIFMPMWDMMKVAKGG
ncbi:MAG: type II secretion system F family protein [Desulfobacteraceae bacterium]|nr:type II secretion system F family protein [Desulfobacteraceae bacterium]